MLVSLDIMRYVGLWYLFAEHEDAKDEGWCSNRIKPPQFFIHLPQSSCTGRRIILSTQTPGHRILASLQRQLVPLFLVRQQFYHLSNLQKLLWLLSRSLRVRGGCITQNIKDLFTTLSKVIRSLWLCMAYDLVLLVWHFPHERESQYYCSTDPVNRTK